MIYCPNCGTANRDGSKFCNECGQPLGTGRVERPEGAEPPDWLQAVREETQREEQEEELPAAQMPAFLWEETDKGLAPPPESDAMQPEMPPMPGIEPISAGAGDLSWLEELGARYGEAQGLHPEEQEELKTTAKRDLELPSWLAGEAESISDSGEQLPHAIYPPEALEETPLPEPTVEIPEWLRELERFPAGEPEGTVPVGEASSLEAETLGKLELQAAPPSWLEAEKGEIAVETGEGGEAEGSEEEPGMLAKAHIPDWLLALRPGARERGEEAGVPAMMEKEPGSARILADLTDVIPIELSVAAPPDVGQIGSLLSVLPEEAEGSQMFAQVIGSKAPARTLSQPKAGGLPFGRVILALLLLLSICVPLLTGQRFFIMRPHQISPAVSALYETIDAIGPGEAVLIAFDFDPSTSGEMEPIAEAIVRHVMSKRARIIALSLMPAGPALAQTILERSATTQADYTYGIYYINLGYLPGKEAALRSLLVAPFGTERMDFMTGRPASEQVVLARLNTLDDFALIIELGADLQSVRWWIEQVGSQVDTPLAAGVSAAVGPYVQPYAEGSSPQLVGLVAGIADASVYDSLANRQDELMDVFEALQWAASLAVGVIVIAIIASLFTRRERR